MDPPEATEDLVFERLRIKEHFWKKACTTLLSSLDALELSIYVNAQDLPRSVVEEMEKEARRVENVIHLAFSQHRARQD